MPDVLIWLEINEEMKIPKATFMLIHSLVILSLPQKKENHSSQNPK